MRVAIGSDHAGFGYKGTLLEMIREEGHEVIDLGTYSHEPADYPDYAEKVALVPTITGNSLALSIGGQF